MGRTRLHVRAIALAGLTGALVLQGAVLPPAAQAATVTVDPGNVYVSTFEGWGTSLAWFANVTGGWSEAKRTAIADALFSPSGVGLNIARYNIGGSSASQQGMRAGGLVRSYLNSDGTYDWSVDANQRWMLAAAKARGVNITEAFSNSPPWFMTKSGDARGASDCGNNLKDTQYEAFAAYLADVVKHFRDNWGTTFRTLDPLNEPSGTWWCLSGRQEGAHFDRPQQDLILGRTDAALKARGLTGTSVSAPDETSPGETTASVNAYSTGTRALLGQLNTHTYGGNATDKRAVSTLAANLGKRLWMSEIDGSAGTHDHGAIAPALWLAGRITEDVNNIRPAAWVLWQPVEDEANMLSENQNWGLIHADLAGTSQSFSYTKKYYALLNYTRFIRPGFRILAASGSTLVAHNPSTGRLVVVSYNSGSTSVSDTVDLSRFAASGSTAAVYRTSATENFARAGTLQISNRAFTATKAPGSVTTYVIDGMRTS